MELASPTYLLIEANLFTGKREKEREKERERETLPASPFLL